MKKIVIICVVAMFALKSYGQREKRACISQDGVSQAQRTKVADAVKNAFKVEYNHLR